MFIIIYDTMFVLIVLVHVWSAVFHGSDGLECYSCTNVTSLVDCSTVSRCPAGSICHNEYKTIQGRRYFTLGCKVASVCQHISTPESVSSGTGGIVGRSAVSGSEETCSECCQEGMCNRRLCQHNHPNCADNTDYNCNIFGAATNLCIDTRHVKTLCKRFCGLCSLVDGGWSQWNTWSSCDVTCDSGTRTRTRQCSDPNPASGGDICSGMSKDTEACIINTKCPVDGGWASWSGWSVCSTSCDIGLQGRHRTCSNPRPEYHGTDCHGDLHEEKLCYPGACADGNWSSWGHWGSCTATCGGGLLSRTRTCDNPAPSITGKSCAGDRKQTVICNNNPCEHVAVSGVHTIAFKARVIANTTLYWHSGDHLVFTTVLLNEGGGYNSATGYFTAPRNGTYLFTVQICTTTQHSLEVFIMANGSPVGTLAHADYHETGSCVSGTGIALLAKGDRVWVQTYSSGQGYVYQDNELWNSFSGVLIGN